MKRILLAMALLVGMTAGAMAQAINMQQEDEQECMEMQIVENDMTGDNSCTLTVYYSDGSFACVYQKEQDSGRYKVYRLFFGKEQ